MPFTIAVAGVSGSGKSTVAKKLKAHFGGTIISSDWYYKDNSRLPTEERDLLNFDIPEGIGFDELGANLTGLRNSEEITAPQYDFNTHCRTGVMKKIAPAEFNFVDGILILYAPELKDKFTLTIYVDAPDEIAKERRIERDIKYRGRTREQAERQYDATVLPSQSIYVKPFNDKSKVDYIFQNNVNLPHENDDDIPIDVRDLIQFITNKVAKPAAVPLPAYAASNNAFFTAAPAVSPVRSAAVAVSDPAQDAVISAFHLAR
jgi:uridine kinase